MSYGTRTTSLKKRLIHVRWNRGRGYLRRGKRKVVGRFVTVPVGGRVKCTWKG